MVGLAGTILGIALARLAGPQRAWLRAAVLAQTADLATFGVMWEHGQNEWNSLARLVTHAALGLFDGERGITILTVGLTLIGVKLALIWYLIRVSPHLGPYREAVLGVAIVMGAIGALSNAISYSVSALPLIGVAGFALVAARWPSRFRDALGATIRLVASAGFALAALVAFASLPSVDGPYVCASTVCRPLVGQLLHLLAINLVVAALIAFWMTFRFAARLMPERVIPPEALGGAP